MAKQSKRGPKKEPERKREVMAQLRQAIQRYGEEAGIQMVREAYPDIHKSTWHRYRKELLATPMDVALKEARRVAKSLPTAPPPQYIEKKPGEAKKNMDFLGRLESLYADAEMLRGYSVITDNNGKEKIRVPTFFAQSVKLRSDLLESALKALAQVWDLQRMQGLYDLILEEIGNADPETQRRITERLQELNDRAGLTMEARL